MSPASQTLQRNSSSLGTAVHNAPKLSPAAISTKTATWELPASSYSTTRAKTKTPLRSFTSPFNNMQFTYFIPYLL